MRRRSAVAALAAIAQRFRQRKTPGLAFLVFHRPGMRRRGACPGEGRRGSRCTCDALTRAMHQPSQAAMSLIHSRHPYVARRELIPLGSARLSDSIIMRSKGINGI
jgi:hypothetical protein